MLPLRTLCRIAFALFAVRLCGPPLLAESFAARHAQDLAGNPADLHFRVDTADGKAFHPGERIPLRLLFSSDAPNKYELNGATYDRSGRLPTEEFVSERENVPDPYQDYFGTGVLGGLGGGLRGYPVLESKPYKIDLDLNDWFRFDLPGHYRFYLKSHRLMREREPGEPAGGRTVDFAAVSNIFELEILPDDTAWSSTKLGEIRAVLNQPEPEQPKPGGPTVPHNPFEEETALARRELRYLATIDAVRLSLDEARKPGHEPDTLLLIGARDRQKTIAAFEEYLADPRVAIREWDIRVRALFTWLRKETLKPLLLSLWQVKAQSDLQQLGNTVEARQKRFEEIVREEAARLIPVVAGKEAEARKVSAEAIASIVPDAARAARLVPPYDYGLSREELIAQFPRFDPEQQEEILTSKWDLVRGSEIVPALRGLIDKAEPAPLPNSSMQLTAWALDAGMAQTALRRLLELAPQEAARILRKDISSDKPRFARLEVLEFIPQDIPEADEAFSGLLKKKAYGVLPLVARFATARLAGQMREIYLSRSWPCDEEENFLTYFIRTTPGQNGNDLLKRAMSNREKRGCYRMLLNRIAAVTWNSAIEAQAIATLDDPDPEAAASAASVLSSYGGAAVEPYLWKSLSRWSETWRGRTQELDAHPITGSVPNREGQSGSALFDAIATAQSWVLDEARRKRLTEMCVDELCKKVWGKERQAGEIPVEASSGGWLYPIALRVEGYSASSLEGLKRKLQQYPPGTAFRWCPQAWNPAGAFSPGQRDDMYKELAGFLSKRSMTLEPYVEKKCMPGIPAP